MAKIDELNRKLHDVNREIELLSSGRCPERPRSRYASRLFTIVLFMLILAAGLFFTYSRISGFATLGNESINQTIDMTYDDTDMTAAANMTNTTNRTGLTTPANATDMTDTTTGQSANASANTSSNQSTQISGNVSGNETLFEQVCRNRGIFPCNLTNITGTAPPSRKDLPSVRLRDRLNREQPCTTRLETETPPGDRLEVRIESALESVKEIDLKGVREDETLDITLEELPPENTRWEQLYLLDFSKVNFSEGTVRSKAKGRSLYKCKTWNSTTEKCQARKVCEEGPNTKDRPACHYEGGWQRLMGITPGEQYEFKVSPEDPVYAEYESDFTAPYCSNGSSPCTAGTSLLACRDSVSDGNGPEPNQPNTIDSCDDGTATYSSPSCGGDESVENITITDLNSSSFLEGDTVSVSTWVHCYGATDDHLGLAYTNDSDASTPQWTLLEFQEDGCPSSGYQQITFNDFTIDNTAGNHSIRVYITYDTAGTPPQSTCAVRSSGSRYDDNDDLVFLVSPPNSPPSTPTSINCDGGNCNSTFSADVEINCSGSTDPDGDSITYTIDAHYIQPSVSSDQESGDRNATAQDGPVLGEAGSIGIENSEWHLVKFKGQYPSTPVVLAVPATENTGDNNGLIPSISMINTTHMNITLCQDQGAATCDSTYSEETLHYMVFDTSVTDDYSWIDAGTTTAQPDGGSNTISWGTTFTNTPYVFATANSYNQGGNIAATAWADSISTTQTTDFIGCTHQGTDNNCDSSTPSETFGYVAIDPVAANISKLSTGSEDISNSQWTGVTFSGSYTDPIMMVTQNDDDGGQDPQYPWARSLTSTGGDIRYCEQDGEGVCDSHTSEFVMWMALESGEIRLEGSSASHESTTAWTQYDNLLSGLSGLNQIQVTVHISEYDYSGSLENSNTFPDLQIDLYNGTGWEFAGNLSATGTGNFTATTTDPAVLTAWETDSNTDLRIRGINMDYNTSWKRDSIRWDGLWLAWGGRNWTTIGNHTETGTFTWNITDILPQSETDLRCRATDLAGSNAPSGNYDPDINLTIEEPDYTAPGSVLGLTSPSKGADWVYWTWTNPPDADFAHTILYLNSTNVQNTSGEQYNATGLTTGLDYTITINTEDDNGNINDTDVTDTQTPEVPPQPPTHTKPLLKSTFETNNTDENLTCYNQSTDDANGDYVKNIYDWKVNGSTIFLTLTPFEGGSTDSWTREYSGSLGYNLTAYATWNSSGGHDSLGAYEFDGSSEYIDLDSGGSSPVYDSQFTKRTVALWYNADSITGASYRVLYSEGGGTNGMNLYIRDSAVWGGAWSESSGWDGNWTGFATTADEWHFAAIVFNGADTNVSLYYDTAWASISDPGATQVSGHSGDDAIGRASGSSEAPGSATIPSGSYFDGTIDEFMVFDRALSREQLDALYYNMTERLQSAETNLDDTWTCEVTPNDGTQDGSTLGSDALTIIQYQDTEPPNVVINSPQPGDGAEQTLPLTINATITDVAAIQGVYADISTPDHGTETVELTQDTGDIYTGSFTNTTALGRYNMTVRANDSSGNTNDTETTWFNVTLYINIQDNESNSIESSTTVLQDYGDGTADVQVIPEDHPIQNITIYNYNTTSPGTLYINNQTEDSFPRTYSIDPSELSFSSADATLTAQGSTLYKCADFNFSTQRCNDLFNYTRIRTDLTAGQNYTITFTPTDPGFGETLQGDPYANDSTMRNQAPDNNYGTFALMRAGRRVASDIYRGIIRFNISSLDLPQGTRIDNAILSLYFFSIPGSDTTAARTHGVHKVQQSPPRDWAEVEVTANNYTATAAWTSFGGDFNSTPTDTASLSSAELDSWIDYNVTTDMQDFYQNQSSNFGWVIRDQAEGTDGTRRDYRSKEAAQTAQRPKLTINYSDIQNPDVTDVSQYLTAYQINDPVGIEANATDNINVSEVWFNITMPNGTKVSQQAEDTDSDGRYNLTFTQTSFPGTYNITVYANDTGGNVNDTETTSFYIEGSLLLSYDVFRENCVGWSAADPGCGGDPDEIYDNTGANLTCQFNTSVPEEATVTWVNLTLVDVVGAVSPATMDGYINSEGLGTFPAVDGTCSNDGQRNLTGSGSDFNNTGTNYAIVDNTGTTQYVGIGDEDGSSTRIMIVEVNYSFGIDLPPVINSEEDSPDPVNQSRNITITANITDDVAVDSAWVDINGTNYSMTWLGSGIKQQFFDGFESGSITSNWTVASNPGTYNRTQVTSSGCGQSSNSGTYFVLMDVSTDGNYETNVLKSAYDFTGATNVVLDFYHFDSGEEDHQIGDHTGDYVASCTGASACGDGVFFTCDGSYWYRLEALGTESTWTNHNINISADPDFCTEVNSSFAIKFMQHDNYGCDFDGRGFDDINMTWIVPESPDKWSLLHNTTTENGLINYTVYANDSIGQEAAPKSGTYYVLGPDSVPPGTVTNLDEQYVGAHWIQWAWTNPTNPDFDHVEVWLNSTFYANVSKPQNYYNATGLAQDTVYDIQTRTADFYDNINASWVNDTARTIQANGSIMLDKFNYEQTEVVYITGSDWDTGDNVSLTIEKTGTPLDGYPKNITPDSMGNFTHSYEIPYNASIGLYNTSAVQLGNTSKNDLEQFNVSNFTGIPGYQPLRAGVELYVYLPPLHNLAGARPEDPFLFVTAFNDNTTLFVEDQDEDGDSDDSRGNDTDRIQLDEGQSILIYIANGTDTDIDDGDYFRVVSDRQVAVWAGSNSPFMAYTVPSESGKLDGEEFYIYGRYDPDFNIPLDLVIHAYDDDTNVRIYDVTGNAANPDGTNASGYTNVTQADLGNLIDNQLIDEGDHITYINESTTPGGHTFYVAANKPVTIISGSLREGSDYGGTENFGRDGGYYAVGENGVTFSELFYTYVSRGGGNLGEDEMYFFSDQTTDVTVETSWDDSTPNETYTFNLNSSNDYYYELVGTNSSPYKKVTSTQPIAILCGPYLNEGTGDMGDFGTSLEGGGVGTNFNIYVPEPGGTGASHAILFAFYNSTYYEIYNSTSDALLASGTIDAGEHYDFQLGTDAHIIINSTKNIAVQITNFDDNIGLYSVASPTAFVDVFKTSDIDEVALGENVTYYVSVKNPGGEIIKNLTMIDQIYNSVSYVVATEVPPLPGPIVRFDTPEEGITQLEWNKSSLQPGEKVNITLVATPTSDEETLLLNRVDVNGTGSGGERISGEDSTVVFLIDNSSPVIQSVIDFPDPQETDKIVRIEAEITDNVFVSSAIVEINGTNYSMTRGSGDMFYYDFNATALGIYNYTVYAADAKGNEALPSGGTFSIKPAADVEPFVRLIQPADGYTEDAFLTNITFECNATDNSGLVNISLYLTDRYNQSFSQNSTSGLSGLGDSAQWELELANGTYTWNCLAYDNDDNPAWSEFNRTVYIRVPDFTPPSVYGLLPRAVAAFNTSEAIEIGANITDYNDIDTVLANISYPNGTTVQIVLYQQGLTEKYNSTFTLPALEGVYDIRFIANDTRGNVNDTETTTFEIATETNQVFGYITDSTNTTVPSTIYVHNRTGHLIWTDDEVYSFRLVKAEPYNITVIPSGGSLNEITYINVTINDSILNFTRLEDAPETYESPYESNWTEAIAWWTRPDFNFSTARINFSYGEGQNLSFWKCPTWNFDARVCVNDTFNTTIDLPDGPATVAVYVNESDPVGGAARRPDYDEEFWLYDVTGLNETERRDNGTLVGTYQDQQEVNFTVGRSYRIEILLEQTVEDAKGRLFSASYDKIDGDWTIDDTGTDSPNITAVNGSVNINPFTVNIDTGTTQDINWNNGNNPVVLDLDQNDSVKYWFVVDIPFNASAVTRNGKFSAKAKGLKPMIDNDLTTLQGSPPSKVNLTFPNNGNNTLLNRTITFIWEAVTDPDGHNLTYEINITSELCADISDDNITATNYTPIVELGTYDECGTYNWSVRAYDGIYHGNRSDSWNFSIQPYVALIFLNDTVDFGPADNDDVNDTTDDNPPPLLIQSDGNVFTDVVNASFNQSFFTGSTYTDSDFQIKADNSTEDYSFNWTGSAFDWINLTTVQTIIDNFDWRDSNDTAEIDVKVHVPIDEPAGEKITGLVFYGEQS